MERTLVCPLRSGAALLRAKGQIMETSCLPIITSFPFGLRVTRGRSASPLILVRPAICMARNNWRISSSLQDERMPYVLSRTRDVFNKSCDLDPLSIWMTFVLPQRPCQEPSACRTEARAMPLNACRTTLVSSSPITWPSSTPRAMHWSQRPQGTAPSSPK